MREIANIDFHPNVTFFVGENGSGKSTVMEGIAVALGFGTEGGTRNVRFQSAGSVSPLHDSLRLARGVPEPRDEYFLRAECFFNVASYMDEAGYLEGYGGRSLHTQSHGESFMAVLLNKLRGNGIYLLDEPEAALSPTSASRVSVPLKEKKPKSPPLSPPNIWGHTHNPLNRRPLWP